MSFFHNDLRNFVSTNLMTTSASVSAVPPKIEEKTMEEEVLEEQLEDEFIDETTEEEEEDDSDKEDITKQESKSEIRSQSRLRTKKREEKFIYLSDDPLTKEFSFNRDIQQNHTIYLCCYKINQVLDIPFLEFYMEKNGLEYDFPQKILYSTVFKDILPPSVHTPEPVVQQPEQKKPSILSSIIGGEAVNIPIQETIPSVESVDIPTSNMENGEMDKDVDDIFLEQCCLFLKEKTGIEENLEHLYKGFVETDNKIIVVFDCTNINFLETKEATVLQNWIILDEIMEKGTITNTPISPIVIETFKNIKVLSQIQTSNRENFPIPRIVYLCEKKEDNYQNIYFEDNENAFNIVTVMNETIEHPILQDIYLFSREPLEEINLTKIKRFIMFINNGVMVQGELTIENIPESQIIGFKENEKEFWCTKSPRFFSEP